MKKIGMVGIGLMGHGIATNILKHGYPMVLFEHPGNQPLDQLKAAGATTTASLTDLAAASDVVILCVTGTPQVEDVLYNENGILKGIRAGSVIVDCSTAIPSSTQRIAKDVQEIGAHFLDAPMTRTPKEAAEGRLNLTVGGDEAIFESVRPILASYTERLVYAGEVGAGHRLKLIHNFVSLGFAAVMAEAAACSKRSGISMDVFLDVIGNGGGAGVVFNRFKPYIDSGDDSAFRFYVSNALKDMSYYTDMTKEMGAAADAADGIYGVYEKGNAAGTPQSTVPNLIEILAEIDSKAN